MHPLCSSFAVKVAAFLVTFFAVAQRIKSDWHIGQLPTVLKKKLNKPSEKRISKSTKATSDTLDLKTSKTHPLLPATNNAINIDNSQPGTLKPVINIQINITQTTALPVTKTRLSRG